MGIKSTQNITRVHAISRIIEIATLIKEENYLAIEEASFETEVNLQKFINNWTSIDLSNIDNWTNKMLEDYMDNPFFRHSLFDNHLIENVI